jgi:hypothetical protein
VSSTSIICYILSAKSCLPHFFCLCILFLIVYAIFFICFCLYIAATLTQFPGTEISKRDVSYENKAECLQYIVYSWQFTLRYITLHCMSKNKS